jgi:5-methyltetrahydropteroyltriglutamate--homocysteine methyltransferase
MDLNEKQKQAYRFAYAEIKKHCPQIKTLLTTYFESIGDNIPLAVSLPVSALHIDLVRGPKQLKEILAVIPDTISLSLGLIDGRNVWKNDYSQSLSLSEEKSKPTGYPPVASLLLLFDLDWNRIQEEIAECLCQTKADKADELSRLC